MFTSWKTFSILLKLGIINLKTKVEKKDQKLKQGTYMLQTKKNVRSTNSLKIGNEK